MMFTSTDAFRVQLIDTFRSLEDPTDLQIATTRLLGEYTNASRVGYADVQPEKKQIVVNLDYTNGVPSLEGVYSYDEYDKQLCNELEAGRTVIRPDIANDPSLTQEEKSAYANLYLGATVNIPYLKAGRLVAILFIHNHAAHQWTKDEISLFKDVAERTWEAVVRARAERNIKNSEEQFRLAAEASRLCAWQVDLITNEVIYSDNAARELGYEELPVGLKSFLTVIDFVHLEDKASINEAVLASFKDGNACSSTCRFLSGSGDYLWIEARAKFQQNSAGRPISIYGVIINIDARKKADLLLRRTEDRYRIALEAGGLASWDWDLLRNKIIWNEQHYRLLGLPLQADERVPDDVLQRIHAEDKDYLVTNLDHALVTGVYEAEFRIIRADNAALRWMKGYGNVTERSSGGVPTRMVGVMHDITAYKELERQKDEFLGIASHELKTPITAIKAYGEVLQEIFEEKGNLEEAGYMMQLGKQVDRLTRLITSLLDNANIKEGQLSYYPQSLDINELISSQVAEFRQMSARHSIVVETCPLPQLTGDEERLIQVLTNLISNAIKYSPEGGQITLRCERDKSDIKISISDQGIGIPIYLQAKVFDRFYRMEYTKQKTFPGMGLGLYITAAIIRRHGGKIGVVSVVDKGSTFFFTLPVGK